MYKFSPLFLIKMKPRRWLMSRTLVLDHRLLYISAAESLLCPVCDSEFTVDSELKRHLNVEHDVNVEHIKKKKKKAIRRYGSHLIRAGGTVFGRPHPAPGEPGWLKWLSDENERQMTYILDLPDEERMNAVAEFDLLWPRHGFSRGMGGLPLPITTTTLREMSAILALPSGPERQQLAREFRERWERDPACDVMYHVPPPAGPVIWARRRANPTPRGESLTLTILMRNCVLI